MTADSLRAWPDCHQSGKGEKAGAVAPALAIADAELGAPQGNDARADMTELPKKDTGRAPLRRSPPGLVMPGTGRAILVNDVCLPRPVQHHTDHPIPIFPEQQVREDVARHEV